jgi:hypothetical protein
MAQCELPNDIITVTGYPASSDWVIDGMGSQQCSTRQPEIIEDQWENSVISNLIGDINSLREQFLLGNLAIACDGSVKDEVGAAAWILSAPDIYDCHYCVCSARAPGSYTSMTSHRAECTGIIGGLITFNGLLESWATCSGVITVICDNIYALRHSFDTQAFSDITKLHDFDILQSIRHYLKPTITYNWKHIKGHQHVDSLDQDFTILLNHESDRHAKLRRQVITSQQENATWDPTLHMNHGAFTLKTIKYAPN